MVASPKGLAPRKQDRNYLLTDWLTDIRNVILALTRGDKRTRTGELGRVLKGRQYKVTE
jgi:hypothetical protein